jgi:hypothetical protein
MKPKIVIRADQFESRYSSKEKLRRGISGQVVHVVEPLKKISRVNVRKVGYVQSKSQYGLGYSSIEKKKNFSSKNFEYSTFSKSQKPIKQLESINRSSKREREQAKKSQQKRPKLCKELLTQAENLTKTMKTLVKPCNDKPQSKKSISSVNLTQNDQNYTIKPKENFSGYNEANPYYRKLGFDSGPSEVLSPPTRREDKEEIQSHKMLNNFSLGTLNFSQKSLIENSNSSADDTKSCLSIMTSNRISVNNSYRSNYSYGNDKKSFLEKLAKFHYRKKRKKLHRGFKDYLEECKDQITLTKSLLQDLEGVGCQVPRVKISEKYNFTIDLENTSYDPPKIEVRNL